MSCINCAMLYNCEEIDYYEQYDSCLLDLELNYMTINVMF